MSANATDTTDAVEKNVDSGSLENQSKIDESNKCANAINRNKNRKRKRHHNNNKNNNKKWCKKFKRQPSQQQQQQQHINKSDSENAQNVKNSNNNRKHLYGGQKHTKSIFKNGSHRNHRGLSKFFLPDKRLRKELIIPPTKFLLGGNISDPLNLNSLQDEALNASENAATPKSSPITTPPKIEVIIPPNIFDPLHLLQPVDSVEYEKLLTTPLKRKVKHRNRKKKPRKRHDSSSSTVNTTSMNISTETAELVINTDDDENKNVSDVGTESQDDKSTIIPSTQTTNERERCAKDLRLDLVVDGDISRKRKSVECPNLHKKVRRLDSMDKIVSPVIPQPGAWKRPPPIVHPMGAPRNRNRVSSTSTSDDIITGCSSAVIANEDQTAAATSTQSDIAQSTVANVLKAENTQPPPKKRPEKAKYPYGDHCSYKSLAALTEYDDVRLNVFKQYPYLFQHKDVLDIGCHAGHVTLAVARMLNPKSVLGIDISSFLISRAQHNQSLFVRISAEKPNNSVMPKSHETNAPTYSKRKKHHRRTKAAYYPISFGITYKGIPKVPVQCNDQTACTAIQNDVFPHNVQFKTMNYVETTEEALTNDTQQYDLIICLSVTKFIHLNFGDAGLKSSFKRMFNQLRPGGKLILEAQNWASYKRIKNLTQTIYNNYKSIEFFPNKFHEFLLSTEVGFSHSSPLAVLKHAKGYRRPLQLYVKGDFTPSQICWSDSYMPQTPYEEPYRAYYAHMRRPRTVRGTVWQSDTPHMSSRFTPSHGLSATSQYYNPSETDSYLPSYDNEIQTRRYCFVSPLYSTVWSPPPSGRKSASQTPLFGSIRKVDDDDETIRTHVYLPTTGNYDGRESSRSNDDCLSQSPRTSHVYAAATPESRSCREPDTEYCSPNGHVYATACDNSSSPQQYSGESSRSVEIEQEDVEDSLTDV